jgi:hypothetical protein
VRLPFSAQRHQPASAAVADARIVVEQAAVVVMAVHCYLHHHSLLLLHQLQLLLHVFENLHGPVQLLQDCLFQLLRGGLPHAACTRKQRVQGSTRQK